MSTKRSADMPADVSIKTGKKVAVSTGDRPSAADAPSNPTGTWALTGTTFTLYNEPAWVLSAALETQPTGTLTGNGTLTSKMVSDKVQSTSLHVQWNLETRKFKALFTPLLAADSLPGVFVLFLHDNEKSGDQTSAELQGHCYYVWEGDVPSWEDVLAMGDDLSDDFMGEGGSAKLRLKAA